MGVDVFTGVGVCVGEMVAVGVGVIVIVTVIVIEPVGEGEVVTPPVTELVGVVVPDVESRVALWVEKGFTKNGTKDDGTPDGNWLVGRGVGATVRSIELLEPKNPGGLDMGALVGVAFALTVFGEESIYWGVKAIVSGGLLSLCDSTNPTPSAPIPANTTRVMMSARQNSLFSLESSTKGMKSTRGEGFFVSSRKPVDAVCVAPFGTARSSRVLRGALLVYKFDLGVILEEKLARNTCLCKKYNKFAHK